MSKVGEYYLSRLDEEDDEVNNEVDKELAEYEQEYEEWQRGRRKALDTAADMADAEIRATEEAELRRTGAIDRYWVAFQGFLGAVGGFSWIVKLEHNSRVRGIYPTQVVEHDYFRAQGGNLEQAKEERRLEVWASIRKLNAMGEQIGLKPASKAQAKEVVNFLIGRVDTENGEDPGVRRKAWFRDNVNRFRAKGEIRSLAELYQRRKELED